MRSGRAAGLFFLAATLLSPAVFAAKTKPVIAVKTKTLEIEVTVDAALKAYPGLYDNLLLKIGPVTLAPSTEANKSSGLTLHYSPYMVGPYVEGPLTAFVPWTDFKDYLSPEGAALFGGSRPDKDGSDLD